jgi:hypothetical protein
LRGFGDPTEFIISFEQKTYLFNVSIAEVLAIAENGDNETSWGGDGNRDVNKVAVNDIIAIDDCIDDGLILEGSGRGSYESRHEAKLYTVLLCENIAKFLADVHEA